MGGYEGACHIAVREVSPGEKSRREVLRESLEVNEQASEWVGEEERFGG